MFKILISLVVSLCIGLSALAQTFEVPEKTKFEGRSEYAKYEPEVVACIDWLENTPVNEEEEKRTDANAFFLIWIAGSPTITIEINHIASSLSKKNADLLFTYMGGWTKHMINNPEDTKDKVKGNIAGVKSVLRVYEANLANGFKTNKKIEKLLLLSEEELENWVIVLIND
jgi:hypothetical protein